MFAQIERLNKQRYRTPTDPLSKDKVNSKESPIQRLGLTDLFGLDQWVPTGGAPTRQDFKNLINAGRINADQLMSIIPAGLKNTFEIEPRSQRGFKFEWGNWHVHGHEPDVGAQAGHVGGAGWVVRIKDGNDWLLSQTLVSNFPVNHANYTAPRDWARANNATVRASSHIPLSF
ncbi:MAG: hypothetical protein ACPGUE_19705 [Marinomonas sp.]